MSENLIVGIVRNALYTSLRVTGPILIVSILVGLIISIFQTATRIQEQALTFVPKFIGTTTVGLVSSSFVLHTLVPFIERIFELIIKMST